MLLKRDNLDTPVWRKLREKFGKEAFGWGAFTNAALFDDEFGYYKKSAKRVGNEGADFYTSVSLKERVFSRLVEAAAKNLLLSSNENPQDYEFYEIGAEPERQIIEGSKVARLGTPIVVPQKAVAISNELLDAQPFERFVFKNGKWQKRMIVLSDTNGKIGAKEILSKPSEIEILHIEKYFLPASVEGFSLDISFAAQQLFGEICAQNWRGIIIFADYFRSAAEICELPNGTVRTYLAHSDSADIFACAGNCDITHSPCIEPLLDIAKENGFKTFPEISQERFFMKNATDEIMKIASSPDPFDASKRELSELLSPVFMGGAFRILQANRFCNQ